MNNIIATGDEVKLECRALIYNYTNKMQWLKNEKPIKIRKDLHIKENHTLFSYRKSLTFDGIRKEDEGEYKCEIFDMKNNKHVLSKSIDPHESLPPSIETSFDQTTLSRTIGGSLTLNCSVSGLPVPTFIWYIC